MKEKSYYYNKAKEYTNEYINIESSIIDRGFEDINHFIEHLMETIDIEFTNVFDDDMCEKDSDAHRLGILDYILTECKPVIDNAIRVRELFERIADDKTVMANFNDNIWDLLEELKAATPETLAAYEKLFFTPEELEELKKTYELN